MILGIDTSCYTTSIALMTETGELLAEKRQLLAVPQGRRGLRQSEAVFQHVQQLPTLLAALPLGQNGLTRVVASTKPRPVADAYMPVFVAGQSFGQALATLAGCPFSATTHQEGHLRAGLWAGARPLAVQLAQGEQSEFLAVHLSGGTTELMRVSGGPLHFVKLELLGGTTDLHAGQFVDRVGVALGLPFPAGPALEELAKAGTAGALVLPSAVQGLKVSFSGPLAQAERLLAQGVNPADLALAVELCLCRTLSKLLKNAYTATGIRAVLIVGGVAANARLQAELAARLPGFNLYFAGRQFSGDNAVGVALAGTRWLG